MNGNAKICSNSGQSKVYANSYISTAQSLTKPAVNAAGRTPAGTGTIRSAARDPSRSTATATRDSSVGSITLLTGSAYNCTVYKTTSHVAGNEMGTLSWNPATKALAASGILYLDGDLVMSGGNANFTGTGTIYVNGRVAISGNMTICGPGAAVSGSTCTGKWNAALGALAVVAVNAGGVVAASRPARAPPRPRGACPGNAQIDVLRVRRRLLPANRYLVRHRPGHDRSGRHRRNPEHTDVPNPPPSTPGAAGSTADGLVGTRRTQQLAPDAGGMKWHFSLNPPVPMVRE